VRKSKPLSGYVDFVHTAEESRTRIKLENPGMNRDIVLEKAIAYTVTYCKRHDILKDFLENLSPEEENMLATEWKLEDALRVREEEGIQRGRKEGEQEGRKEGRKETAKNLKSLGIAMEYITRATGLSYDEIAKL
jgi:predicted transposase/invertase (TIGR01784 family)